MNRLLLVAAILTFFPPGIYAQKYDPNFDKGPDLAEFRKAATEDPAFQTCMPFPPARFDAVKTISIKDRQALGLGKDLFLRAGSYFGDLQIRVTGNAAHLYARKYVPPLQESQDPAAKELLIQWENITNARTLLLNEAQSLEHMDSKLYADGEQIGQNAVALNKEIEALKAEIAAYNAECAGQPVTEKCTNWRKELVKWQEDLKKKIADHDANYSDWQKRANELTSSVNGWRSKLKAWEQAILYFIEKAQAFLKDTGNCTPQQHEDLQTPIHPLCDRDRACKQWNPNNPAEDCVKWREYYQRNIDCHNARREINQVCFNGGNPIHQDKEREAAETAENCWNLIQGHCLKRLSPSIPGRRYGGGF